MADGIIGDAYAHKSSLRAMGERKVQMAKNQSQSVSRTKYEKARDLGEKIIFVNRLRDDLKVQGDFISHNKSLVKLKLGEQERAVRQLQSVAESFKESLVLFNDGTVKDPSAFMGSVRAKVETVEKEGNSRVGDSYIFAGSITNQPPFDLSLVAEGIPENSGYTDAYYGGNSITTPIATDENVNLDVDILGTQTGIEKLIRSMKISLDPSIKSCDSRLNAAQNLVDEAINELAALISEIGSKDAGVDDLIESQENRMIYLQEKYDDIVAVDDLELASEFMADQRALSMAYEMMRQLDQMSLVDFLK